MEEPGAALQIVRAVAGNAYGAISADIHVFGDGSPVYLLFEHHRTAGADPRWLRAQPSRMLDARSETVDFTGRDSELELLTGWRDAGTRLAVRWLHGEGGQGKTRLAAEFAALSQAAGWKVVDAVHGTDTHPPAPDSQDLRLDGHQGVLVLVDYADRWPLSHLSWLFQNQLLHRSVPARVLLIARSAQGWQAVRGKLAKLRGNIDTSAQRLEPLPDDGYTRERTFTTARDCFARGYPELRDAALIAPPDSLGLPHFALTLTVHMAALVAVDAAAHARHAPLDPLGLTVYLLDREHENWRQLYENAAGGLDFRTPDTVLARMVFIASLTGAAGSEAAGAVLSKVLPEVTAEHALRDHALCYPPTDPAGANTLEPLLPDRLAEDFLALTLPGSPTADYPTDDWAAGAVRMLLPATAAIDTAPRFTPRALTFLAAAAARWPHVGRLHLFPLLDGDPAMVRHANSAAITALADLTELPVELMSSIDEQFPDRRSDLDVGIAKFTRRRVQRQLAAEPGPEPTVQARLWYDLAYRENHAGRISDALPSARQAVTIREQLGAGQEAGLAKSLNMLALLLSDLGRSAEALQHADRAVELSRRLAADDPAHAVDLARNLLNRGSHRHDLGRWTDALADTAEAVDIREQLADGDPQATAAYAAALHNLGRMLQDLDRRAEALDRADRATALYRELAEREPLVYEPNLATALSSVSSILLALGRPDEALKPAHEAAELSRGLMKLNPVFQAELAVALINVSASYSALRQYDAACQAADEAVALYRELSRSNISYLRRFADALDNLGIALLGTDRADAALAAREESVAILRELVEDNPAAHETSLADALSNLGAVLTGLGRPAEALGHTEEAIAIHRRRTDHGADANVATALQNRGLQLSLAGPTPAAMPPDSPAPSEHSACCWPPRRSRRRRNASTRRRRSTASSANPMTRTWDRCCANSATSTLCWAGRMPSPPRLKKPLMSTSGWPTATRRTRRSPLNCGPSWDSCAGDCDNPPRLSPPPDTPST
ncbi:MAG: hypothetical protein AUG49_17305 [Catenulispora sp. 13_1_20CM_3_70_7]|nr:MAG: hypothetical protein AUG49_17305 [Catenulispora sp. 13_1_20CM_3_70_7]